jgi:hypothetical protein
MVYNYLKWFVKICEKSLKIRDFVQMLPEKNINKINCTNQ